MMISTNPEWLLPWVLLLALLGSWTSMLMLVGGIFGAWMARPSRARRKVATPAEPRDAVHEG
jgi:hypothetical protein